jgi:hypothetical protein
VKGRSYRAIKAQVVGFNGDGEIQRRLTIGLQVANLPHSAPQMGVWLLIPPWSYCPSAVLLIQVDIMGAELVIHSTVPQATKSIPEKLADLYSRRATVETLIRCLESYAECQAKHEGRERLRSG